MRSQNKKLLEKINSFEIVDESTIQANNFPYGTYKTKERALEVLEEIQTIIRWKYATNFDYKAALSDFKEEDVQHMLEQMAVYEMPEN